MWFHACGARPLCPVLCDLSEQRSSMKPNSNVEVIPLGGMGEIGKNMMVIRYQDEMFVIDGGLAFPDDLSPGVDLVIPRIDYLQKYAGLIRGWILTHGHEDHIGALPYILPRLPKIPMYGPPLALGLLREKLSDFGIRDDQVSLNTFTDDATLKIGRHFVIEVVRMTHSIPDNFALVIRTPAGTIVHSGDFKLDPHPADGKVSQLDKLAAVGQEGVLLLISDSTNAERPGTTPSELEIAQNIEAIVAEAKGRVFITTFASHIHRTQNIVNIAEKYRRRVVLEGRSMVKYASAAQQLGILQTKEPFLASDEMADLGDSQVLFMCTGSQGQPMSALSRLAVGTHSKIAFKRGDWVLLCSNPIPGNEDAVNRIINRLYQIGVEVFCPPNYKIHASGHASQDELRTVLELVRPQYFLPWHGEPRHQVSHMRLAQSLSHPPKRTLIASNGDAIVVGENTFKIAGRVPSGETLVDGLGVGDVSEEVLTDRQTMGTDGVLVVIGLVHPTPHVELITRGFARSNKDLEDLIRGIAMEVLEAGVREKRRVEEMRDDIYGAVRKFVRKITGRSPIVIPILVE